MSDGTCVSVYSNAGNPQLLALKEGNFGSVLDVGCGAGDNARLIRRSGCDEIVGITVSLGEKRLAAEVLDYVWLRNLEDETLDFLGARRFDTIICSHVLEHLREPWNLVERLLTFLRPGGQMLIAVPNLLYWRQRLKFVFGDFDYTEDGVLDLGHLRFFTYRTAAAILLGGLPKVSIRIAGAGSIPLGPLRRRILSEATRDALDRWGARRMPNLFASQVLISVKREPAGR